MKLIVGAIEKVARLIGLSDSAVSGVVRLSVTAAYQAAAAGIAALAAGAGDLDLPRWIAVGVGAVLQGGDKWLRSR